jgi:uncharacterized protein (DUF1015 family)
MAQIFPFRALRYNPARVKLADVVTQPYDKITPEMQDRYYNASPGNLVRIILGKREPNDSERDNVYTRAAIYLRDWRRNNILVQDSEPSLYAYSQRFTVPGSPEPVLERRGFIGTGRLEDYDSGIIFRHEQTLSGPKLDRLNLLRATRAHFGQIFMLYSDPQRKVEKLLFAGETAPCVDVQDEYGVQHRLWKISDPLVIAQVQAAMADKKLIIADGHHRYETALNYRNECRAAAAEEGTADPEAPYERVMMTLVNMDAEGLVILPTHRVVFGLPNFDVLRMVEQARAYFTVNPLRERVTAESATRLLQEKGRNATALIAVTAAADFILEARPDVAADDLLQGLSPRQRRLDVVQLHKILLEGVLGISEEDIRNKKYLDYLREPGAAIDRVRAAVSGTPLATSQTAATETGDPGSGAGKPPANVAFLMNPVPISQMRDVAFAGEVMPQKSTDFYPKLLSGLTIYPLE